MDTQLASTAVLQEAPRKSQTQSGRDRPQARSDDKTGISSYHVGEIVAFHAAKVTLSGVVEAGRAEYETIPTPRDRLLSLGSQTPGYAPDAINIADSEFPSILDPKKNWWDAQRDIRSQDALAVIAREYLTSAYLPTII